MRKYIVIAENGKPKKRMILYAEISPNIFEKIKTKVSVKWYGIVLL